VISGPSMLSMPLSEQTVVFLRAVFMGMFCGAIYDIFRITRIIIGVQYRNSPKSKKIAKDPPLLERLPKMSEKAVRIARNITVVLGDMLFSLVCGVVLSVFIYRYCSGIIRFYVFLGSVLGFAAYYNSIGRFVIFVSDKIVFFITFVLKRLLCVILFPFVFISDRVRLAIKEKRKKIENESE